MSLRQIADVTKISPALLDALERDDVSRLPGGIFVRAFVRAYASEVGLDPEEMVREFLRRHGEVSPSPAASARAPDEESAFESEQRVARVLLRMVLVSVPLAAVILYYTLGTRPQPATPDAAPLAAAEPPPVTVPPPAPAVPAADPGVAPAGTGVPATVAGEMVLEVHPTARCWVEIVVDGQRAIARELQAGDRETLRVREIAVIRVGDAGAFAFSINGREGRPLGAAGEVRTASISRESMASFLR